MKPTTNGCSYDRTEELKELPTKPGIPSSTKILATFWIFLCLCGLPYSTWAAATALPSDANVINVRDPRFGAYGDGVHDDTAAIQAAIRYFDSQKPNARYLSPQFIYFPPGAYKVSKTLDNNNGTGWNNCSVQFWGAGTKDVIIKLDDNCPGFTSAVSPKPIFLWKGENGAGNQAFRNDMANMTIDVGSGNAGAIGLKYSSCNEGFLENVVVKSSDPTGKGYRGVWVYEEPDCLLQNITVEGFDIGIYQSLRKSVQ